MLQVLIERYNHPLSTIVDIERPMFQRHIDQVDEILEDGISKLTLSFVKDVIFLEMFYNIPTSLTEVVVKGSYLPDSAMQNSSNLRKVTLSNEITYIPKNAFKDCYYLTEIYFGNIIF